MILGDLDPTAPSPLPAWCSKVFGINMFEDVVVVDLRCETYDAEMMQSMSRLNRLEELFVSKRELRNVDLEGLCELRSLRVLMLRLSTSPDEQLLDRLSQSLPKCEITTMVVGVLNDAY